MTKYIIKNCPNCLTAIYPDGSVQEYQCGLTDKDCLCVWVTKHCLLKQIVEKCKDAQKTQWVKNKKKPYSPSKAAFAREILKLLEIEEVE